MSEDTTERSQAVEEGAEKKALSTADANAARNASASEVKDIQNTNPNKFESMTNLPTIKDGKSLTDAKAEYQSFGIRMTDDSIITGAGIEAPAKTKISVDPRPSFVDGLRAIGDDEEAQGRFSIEYMERKGKEALAALKKPASEEVLIASNLTQATPNVEQMHNIEEIQGDSVEVGPDAVVAQDWGALIKKGFERVGQAAQNPELREGEEPPLGGDSAFPHRGREDEFIDYDACSKANTAFPSLKKYIGDGLGKIDPDLIAATIRNEQFYYMNVKDTGPDHYVKAHGNWPFDQRESIGPAQIQVRNINRFAHDYPKQLGEVADAVRNAEDIHHAPYFVGAYFADVIHGIETKQKPDYITARTWENINKHWEKGERNEALIIAYNPHADQVLHVFTQLDNIKAPDWD